MEEKSTNAKPWTILRTACLTLASHREIFFPFCIIAFFQLFALEILYFMPRFPLNKFFGPVISKLWSQTFLHYPLNLTLVPKLFQYAQIPIFIFISSFLIGVAVSIIYSINKDEDVKPGKVIKDLLPSYVHIMVAALISFLIVFLFYYLYSLVFKRALIIRSASGPFYWIKAIIIYGAPFWHLLLSIIGTTLFAYVIPLIVIEKQKILTAILKNFRIVFGSLWTTFIIVFVPTLLYIFILLIRKYVPFEAHFPEMRIISLVLSVFVVLIIDVVVYTSLTTHYLLKRGH